MIFNVGDWVMCLEMLYPGKVISIDNEKEQFTADFLAKPKGSSDESAKDTYILPILDIVEVVTDPRSISTFEQEMNGECFPE